MGRAFEYRKARKLKRWGNMSRTFTRIGKEITIAAKAGGPDPDTNPRLRALMQNAKAANMPKDTVERAIKKATDKDAGDYKEIVYEGYGPYGIAIVVEAATDNNTRTVANVRSYFTKHGGSLGTQGSLTFLFDHKVVLKVNAKSKILKFWTLFIPQKKEEGDETPQPGDIAPAKDLPDNEPQFEIADCCKPIPGDKVVGYRDPATGRIIVHKATCDELNRLAAQYGKNIVKEEIKWSQHKAMSYLVTLELRGIDRQGLLLDLAKVVSDDFNINIREVNIHSHDGIFEGNVSLYVKDAESLSAVMDKMRKIKGIETIKRKLN